MTQCWPPQHHYYQPTSPLTATFFQQYSCPHFLSQCLWWQLHKCMFRVQSECRASAAYQCFICWTPNLMRFTSFHLPNLKLPQNKSTIKPEGNSVLSTDDSFTSACRASTRHKQHCLSVFHVRISDCSLFTDLCDVTWPVRPPLGAGLFSIGVWWLMLSSAFLFSLNLIVVFWDLSRYVIIIRLKQCYTTHLTENFEDDSAADTMWYFISLHDND